MLVSRPTRMLAYFFLLVNTITWGAALVVVKPSLEVTTPFRYLFYRFVLASILSLPICWYYLPKIKKRAPTLSKIIGLELLGTTLALSLLYFGLAKTSALEASFLTTTTPLFVVAAGIWYLHEKEEFREWIGLALAFGGTLLLTFLPLLLNGGNLDGISVQGNILIIAQNCITALYFVLAKKYYKKLPKLFVAAISFYVGMLTFAFLSLAEVGFSATTLLYAIRQDLSFVSVWVAAGYMAIFGSIIGLTAYVKGQDSIEASEASLFSYLQPLVYVPLGILLLGEHLYWQQVVALLLILVGVVVAEKRNRY